MIVICPENFVAFAKGLADLSRPVAQRYFRAGLDVADKLDDSPVTKADREVEVLLRERLTDSHPHHGVIGEEHGAVNASAEFVWVIDPIDGTRAFISGRPLFGTLIALLQGGAPILGVIDMPALEERWVGAVGHPTRFLGAVDRARACLSLEQAHLGVTSPLMFSGSAAEAFERVRRRVKDTHYGGDCYNYGLVAGGHLDLVVEIGLKSFDYCALVPVVQGAGGHLVDWRGAPLTLDSDGDVVAAGDRRVLDAVLEELSV